jgi:hypothetical protein
MTVATVRAISLARSDRPGRESMDVLLAGPSTEMDEPYLVVFIFYTTPF